MEPQEIKRQIRRCAKELSKLREMVGLDLLAAKKIEVAMEILWEVEELIEKWS